MPKVGDKEFSYDAAGMAAAKKESEMTGIPMKNAMERSMTEYAGGGKIGFDSIGRMPSYGHGGKTKMYGHGGKAKMYEDGGKVKKSLKDRIKSVADKIKSSNASKSLKTYKDGKVQKKEDKQISSNLKKINKMAVSAEKKKKGSGQSTVKLPKNVNPAKIKATGKIRKKPQSVTTTEGGAFPTYKKKSKAAKSFRKAFAEARSADKKTFMWDGRKYSTKVK